MNWITKLERKFGRYCIPNLISILIGGQILVYAVELFVNQYISFYLNLDRGALLAGQIWRAAERGFGHLLHLVHRHGTGKRVGRFPL